MKVIYMKYHGEVMQSVIAPNWLFDEHFLYRR